MDPAVSHPGCGESLISLAHGLHDSAAVSLLSCLHEQLVSGLTTISCPQVGLAIGPLALCTYCLLWGALFSPVWWWRAQKQEPDAGSTTYDHYDLRQDFSLCASVSSL